MKERIFKRRKETEIEIIGRKGKGNDREEETALMNKCDEVASHFDNEVCRISEAD